MSILLRRIGAGVALPLTALFTSSASGPALSTPIKNEISTPSAVTAPVPDEAYSQEAEIHKAVEHFRSDFSFRVRNADYSGKWNKCFSTKYGSQEYDYNPAVVRELRRVPIDYRAAIESVFGKNKPERIYSSSFHFSPPTPVEKVDEVKKDIVVLDLGHGHEVRGASAGYDTGTIDPSTGLRETAVIDRTGLALKEKLERDYNVIVVLTRDPISEGLTLKDSTSKFANQKAALQIRSELSMDLADRFPDRKVIFASIHGNSGANSGAEIYYYAPHRGGMTDSPSSRGLAKSIAQNFRLHAGSRTQILSDDFAVLRCQTNPAVLVELGYLQNSRDRAALAQTDRIASQLAEGIGEYFQKSNPKPNVPSVTIAMSTP